MSTARHNTEAATALVAALHDAGMRHAVISPGSRNTPLSLAFAEAETAGLLSLEVVLDERIAAFMALGIARATGRPVAVSCTSGSALAHHHPAVVEADRAGIPLVILTADRPPELQHRGAAQTVDQQDPFGRHVRLSLTAPTPCAEVRQRSYRSLAVLAVSRALGENPGPIHLNLPFREPLWEPGIARATLREARLATPPVRLAQATATPAARAIRELAELSGEPCGLIVAGTIDHVRIARATRSARLRTTLQAITRRCGWPLIADAASPCNTHAIPGLVQHGDAIARASDDLDRFRPALVVVIGGWPTSKALCARLHRWAEQGTRVISIPGRQTLEDPLTCVDDIVHGDLVVTLERWLAELGDVEARRSTTLPTMDHEGWHERWLNAGIAASRQLDRGASSWFEGAAARLLSRCLPPGSLLHLGSSLAIRDFDLFGAALDPDVVVCSSRGANGIDGTIATFAGEVAATGRQGVALIGDLTFQHDASTLLHLARTNLPLTILVQDNGGGGIFEHLPIAAHPDAFDRLFLTPQPVTALDLALGMGLDAVEVSSLPELRSALLNAIPADGLHVIVASYSRRASFEARRAALNDATRQAAHAIRTTNPLEPPP